jgi:hypothetical protein
MAQNARRAHLSASGALRIAPRGVLWRLPIALRCLPAHLHRSLLRCLAIIKHQ